MVEYWLDTAPSSVLRETGEADTFEVPVSWEVMNNSGRGIQDFIRADTSRTMQVHRACMLSLDPRTMYNYRVGSNSTGWSSVFAFVSQPLAAEMKGAPVRIGWLADFGVTNGRSLPLLMKEAGAFTDRRLDAIIHVGDIAYDLDCRADELGPGSEHAAVMTGQANGLSTVTSTGIDGFIGDAFMRGLEPVAAAIPYMVSPGNHEFSFNHTAFTNRFNGMPANAAPIPIDAGTNVGRSPRAATSAAFLRPYFYRAEA
jgi:phosphodiesterase/alkaline phosphatase D-like protein